ncbi:MerR family transcriptional regulator [Streptomyces albipurpureus]|uniref:MerR family transcriptional regulator n=1 Tax=Streptomyces albipurpureus TaxID=2897419 RepID=A0ABT0UV03_9ACTN|nr:MerR family transcriptional regulator [Streptomyces sp. CWNU-1]MCM2391940.1 MerR family transcriptional regulator [Streptomyces sp. CWNU-1]
MGTRTEPVGDGAGLTTGAVARRLGVAPTTLRSWDQRYGIGPAAHVGGKHRRWREPDIAVLARMCALTSTGLPPAEAARIARTSATTERADRTPSPAGRPGAAPEGGRRRGGGTGLQLADVRQECRGLARAALRLDADSVDDLLASAIADHGLVTAWNEVIVPTLMAVGRKWESVGERYIEVEHLLSWHVSSALRRTHAAPSPVRAGPPVLLACVPGEGHTLPLEALAAALMERDLPVRMFGAALPFEALDGAVRRMGPAAVVLWAQSRTTASRPLAQHVAGMRWGVRGARRAPLVLTAGPGWAGPHVPGTVRPLGLEEALVVLGSIR